MKHRYTLILLVPALLLAGVFIYFTQRSDDIYLNQWVADFGDGEFFTFLQSFDLSMPSWVVYSLPDGLWMAALVVLILAIWNFRLNHQSWLCLRIAIVFGILMEVFQSVGLVSGTFDVLDILCILLGAAIPILYVTLTGRKANQNSLSAYSLDNR